MIDSDQVTREIDAEVKRIADLFRFILKYKEQFQASGIEFSDLREYVSSDDASRIDWKNSAKSMDLYVKEYEEDKDMDVFIVLDVSDTMMFGTAEKLKSEYAALMTAALSYASVNAGINVGVGLFGENDMTLTPDGGQKQYRKILHEVTNYENYGGEFSLEHAMNETIGQIQEDTAIFVISDFFNVGDEWKSKLKLANLKFRHVMTIILRDLRDYQLPESGNFRFESPDGEEQMIVNTSKVKEKFESRVERQEQELKDKLRGSGSAFLKIDTRDNFAGRFARYFDQNQEQW